MLIKHVVPWDHSPIGLQSESERGKGEFTRGFLWREIASPISNPAIFYFQACDNTFWPKHCVRINIHVIPDCRWKMWRRYQTNEWRRVFDRRGQLARIFAVCSQTRTSFEACADTEMFIPCCSCKNYGKDGDSKIRLEYYEADVVLIGGKTLSFRRPFGRRIFIQLVLYLSERKCMFINSRNME